LFAHVGGDLLLFVTGEVMELAMMERKNTFGTLVHDYELRNGLLFPP